MTHLRHRLFSRRHNGLVANHPTRPVAPRVIPAPSSLYPREPVGRYIRVLTTQGMQIFDRSILDQDAVTLIGQHWNAVMAVIRDKPDRYNIHDFRGIEVVAGVELLTDEEAIWDLSVESDYRGELDYDDEG
jgi:hypothetical protein